MNKIKELFWKFRDLLSSPSHNRTLVVLGIILLAIIIPVTVVFLGQRTNLEQSAHIADCPVIEDVCDISTEKSNWCPSSISGANSHSLIHIETNVNCGNVKCTVAVTNATQCGYNPCPTSTSSGCKPNTNQWCTIKTANCTNYYSNCSNINGKCGYNSTCQDSSGTKGTCYTNNSCGAGQHEIDPASGHACSSGFRICCAAGAPKPWYDCEKNGAMGGNIVKHTPATSVVTHCDSIDACQDPSVNLLFIDDGPNALTQAKAGLCRQAPFTDTVKACIANRMCTDVTVASSIWAGINYEITNVLYASCNVLFAQYGPIKDFFCSNAANLRNTVVAKVSSGVINTCLTEVKGATTAIDVGAKAEKVCVNACSSVISINTNGLPGPLFLIIGAVRSVLSSAAVPVCQAICPHFASSAAQNALSVCFPGSSITPVSEPGPSSLADSAKKGISSRTCSNQKGVCKATHTDCPSGYTRDLGLDTTCGGTGSNEICCTPNEGGGCTGSSCGGGGTTPPPGGGGGGGTTPPPSCQNGQTTQMALSLKLEGIGSGSFENNSPAHTTRPGIYVKVIDQNGTSAYNNTTTTFTYSNTFNAPNVNLGTSLSCGHTYTATVKIPRYLPAKATVAYGKSQTLTLNPIAGDINKVRLSDKVIVGDDKIDVNDYAILRACHNVDPTTPQTFTDNTTTVTVTCADLMNFFDYADGGTQGDEWSFNYNLWVRGYFKANGY